MQILAKISRARRGSHAFWHKQEITHRFFVSISDLSTYFTPYTMDSIYFWSCIEFSYAAAFSQDIVWCIKNRNYLYSKIVLVKCSGNNFIFLLEFYLIMCFMKAQKNFGKITILKIWELVSLGGVKTHFGKLAMKWCIFRHDKKMILTNIKM